MSAEEHPSLVPVALIVNSVRNGKKGTPRAIAQEIITEVFKGETSRWADADDIVEGGREFAGNGKISQNDTSNASTHHRRVLVFYGEWEEGEPPEEKIQRERNEQAEQDLAKAARARAAFTKGMDLPPTIFEVNATAPASAGTHSMAAQQYKDELRNMSRLSLDEARSMDFADFTTAISSPSRELRFRELRLRERLSASSLPADVVNAVVEDTMNGQHGAKP